MAGHAGKAFWFSKASAEFVTSNYYYDAYPDWVTAWNDQAPTAPYQGAVWELMHPVETYLFGDRDDQPWQSLLHSTSNWNRSYRLLAMGNKLSHRLEFRSECHAHLDRRHGP